MIRVGWCAKTVSSATAPFAIVSKLGWSPPGYADFMHKYGIIKQPVKAADLITNDLIADINKFDAAKITAEAKAYK